MSSLKPNLTFAQRYTLVERIGFGGFAEVWKVQRESGFMQAIKIFNRLDDDSAELARMEFERVFNLNHHRLLKATDFGVYEGQPYLVMPLLEKGNAYKQVGQLDEKSVAKVMLDISAALAFLHNLPDAIIHQDIKPDNFLIDNHGNYLLSDFGISKQLRRTMTQAPGRETMVMDPSEAERFQRSGYTPLPYRPPETTDKDFEKRKPIKASDIWALGASLFELATGEVPFGEFGGMVQRQDPTPPDLPASFSSEFNEVLHLCMAKEPWDRPTAPDLEKLTTRYMDTGVWDLSILPQATVASTIPQEAEPIVVQPPTSTLPQEKKKRPIGMWVAIVLGLLVIGGGGAYFATREEKALGQGTDQPQLSRPDTPAVVDPKPDAEEQAYQKAIKAKSQAAYQAYLAAYPSGEHVSEIQGLLDQPDDGPSDDEDQVTELDHQAFDRAKQQHTTQAYQDYLDAYPDGLHVEEAKQNRDALAAEEADDQEAKRVFDNFIAKGDNYLKRNDCEQATYYYRKALNTGYDNALANRRIQSVASSCAAIKVCRYPRVGRKPSDPSISRIEVSSKETVITLTFKQASSSGQLFAPGHPDAFRLEKSKGNVLSPLRAVRGMNGNAYGVPFTTPLKSFKLVFDPIPDGTQKVSLIEGTSLVEGETYWNFININLNCLNN